MRQETTAQRVLISEQGEHHHPRVVISHGCTPADATKIAEELEQLDTDQDRERYAKKHDAAVIPLRSSNAQPYSYIYPRTRQLRGYVQATAATSGGMAWSLCASAEHTR